MTDLQGLKTAISEVAAIDRRFERAARGKARLLIDRALSKMARFRKVAVPKTVEIRAIPTNLEVC
jgi:hypothetical protein